MSKVKVEQNLDLRKGIESRLEMIKLLIPLGLQAIKEMLEEEVDNLAGEKYQRDESELRRWGSNLGSAYLGGQKVSFPVPRVRNIKNKQEIPLESYKALQNQASELRPLNWRGPYNCKTGLFSIAMVNNFFSNSSGV